MTFSTVDINALLDGFTWLHLSGITPALGPNCRRLVMDCLRVAREKGLTVSFDGNFRSTLWSWEGSPGLLHGMPALCGRSAGNRTLSPLER